VDDFNPYTAPETNLSPGSIPIEAEEGRGVWRDGKMLVMSKYATLPSRCVKCDEPATDRLLTTISWHHPAVYLVLLLTPIGLIGLIGYLILMLIKRRSMQVEIPLCRKHRRRRSRGIVLSWVFAPPGMIILILGFMSMNPAFPDLLEDRDLATLLLVTIGLAMMIFGLILGVTSAQIVTARRIDKTHAWLNKIHPQYLAALPVLPYGDEAEADKGEQPATHQF
jgi:MFS family permease